MAALRAYILQVSPFCIVCADIVQVIGINWSFDTGIKIGN